MANTYTTTVFLADLKRTGHIPASQTPFQDADLLALADYELQTAVLRQIVSVKENYYLTYTDYDITADSYYEVPVRAIGGAVAFIQIVDGTSLYSIARSEISEQFSTVTSPSGYFSFYLQGNGFVLRPNPETGSIRVWYYRRPNNLISTSSAAQITGISGLDLTVSAVPSTITTSVACDIVDDQPHFNLLVEDSTPTATTSTIITLSSVPTTVAIGDWISPAGQSPILQIPVEFKPLLIQRVVVKYYEIQGYLDKMAAAQKKLEAMEKDLFELINPRVSEAPKRIVPDSNIIGGYRRWRAWRAT